MAAFPGQSQGTSFPGLQPGGMYSFSAQPLPGGQSPQVVSNGFPSQSFGGSSVLSHPRSFAGSNALSDPRSFVSDSRSFAEAQPVLAASGSARFMAHRDRSFSFDQKGGDCQDQQCAEEECDPEECGDENRPPNDDNYTCGVDRRPLLPFGLIASTLLGAFSMLMLQRPLMRSMVGSGELFTVFFVGLYSSTLLCMAYCGLCDPGQLERQDQAHGQLLSTEKQDTMTPKRAHKAWLYALPIRRYDHYCRWLTNCIGLLNHREFILMCIGIVSIGLLGSIVDLVLFFPVAAEGTWRDVTFILLHLGYSMTLVVMAGPILRLHIGLISRNELANDWKKNSFYCITSNRSGKRVPVNELSDDEFNERFDSFEYDVSRNPWDRGLHANCLTFWCTPRWQPGQLGEF